MNHIKDLSHLSQPELALLWGVSVRTIQRLPDADTLRHGEKQGCYYVWDECWDKNPKLKTIIVASGEDLSDRDRKIRAEADLAEMEAAKEAGQLLDAADVKRTWSDFLGRLKVNLDGLPDRAAPLIEDGMNLAEKAAAVRRELNSIRRDLVAETEHTEAT